MSPSPAGKIELDACRVRYEKLLRKYAAFATLDPEAPRSFNTAVARTHYAERQRRKANKQRALSETYTCPITLSSKREMVRPTIMSDGYVYERDAILQWLTKDLRSPMTRCKLEPWGVDALCARKALDRLDENSA